MKVIAILLIASASGSILSADRVHRQVEYRPDGRCGKDIGSGKNFLLPSGEPAWCHGSGCCSIWGWCGTSAAHCTADHVRSDGRCGKKFRLPSGEPGRCNANDCCSYWGWCGDSKCHCNDCTGGSGGSGGDGFELRNPRTDYNLTLASTGTRTSATSDVARSATNFTTSGL